MGQLRKKLLNILTVYIGSTYKKDKPIQTFDFY